MFSTLKSPTRGRSTSSRARGQAERGPGSVEPHFGLLHPDLRGGIGSARDANRPGTGLAGGLQKGRRPRVVQVHHRACVGSEEVAEQEGLRLQVGVHGLVKIQVLRGEIRHRAHLETAALDPSQGEAVGGHLQRGSRDTAGAHGAQGALEIEALRRRVHRPLPVVRVPDLHGADDSHGDSGRLEDRLDEEGGAGLAVGAGYADQPEFVRRVSVETPRDRRQGASRIGNRGHRSSPRLETLGCRFHQKCRGSQIQSLGQVFVAVVVLPAQGDEEIPRRDPSRVVGHAPDDRVVAAGTAELRSQVGGRESRSAESRISRLLHGARSEHSRAAWPPRGSFPVRDTVKRRVLVPASRPGVRFASWPASPRRC